MPVWARLVIGVAVFRVAAALSLYLAGWSAPSSELPVPAPVYALQLVAYTALGLTLIVTARDDVRAAWLGMILIAIVAPFTNILVRSAGTPATVIDAIRPDAFLAAALWRFAAEFPSPAERRVRTTLQSMAGVTAAIAAFMAVVNLSLLAWPAARETPLETLGWRATFVTWNGVGSLYWPVLFLLSALGLLVLGCRMVASTGEHRVRARIFVAGLAAGLLPFLVEVLVEELWPAYKAWAHGPAVEPVLAVVLFSTFSLVPFITAYSVIYDRVVETSILIRAAIQYALARYTIMVATAVPLAALGLYFHQHRTERLIDIVSGSRPLILLGAAAAGVVAFRLRRPLLHRIDRRFFREVHDTGALVSTLISTDLVSRTPLEISERLREAVERVMHARADLYVVDDEGAMLRDPAGGRPPLSTTSTLMSLALTDSRPMDVDPVGVAARLPDGDRRWLAQGPYTLLMAFKLRDGSPAGLLALTGKRSELPYSPVERHSLQALAAPLALVIENDRLRRGPEPASESHALECNTCARLHAVGTPACSCGGRLGDAPAPHILRGVFRFEQRIGAGGMGVVYRATDLSLGRDVAIKTLPHVTPDRVLQLKREAQAMASVVHANLAAIHGIESWRGTPFLVQEYLAGGMLSHRLRRGPLAIEATLEIGVALAQVLGQLHAAGIVHCDLKPSNIGFGAGGTVKLVDFGLVYLLRDSARVLATTVTTSSDGPADLALIVTRRGLIGTPAYMSPEATLASTPAPSFDLWSLSIVLFECIAGTRPFHGETADELFYRVNSGERPSLEALRPDCGGELARFFDRALAVERDRRPRSAAELEEQLLALRSSLRLS